MGLAVVKCESGQELAAHIMRCMGESAEPHNFSRGNTILVENWGGGLLLRKKEDGWHWISRCSDERQKEILKGWEYTFEPEAERIARVKKEALDALRKCGW